MQSEKTLCDKFGRIAECCRNVKREQERLKEAAQAIEAESGRHSPITTVRGVSPVIQPKGRA